MWLWSSSQLASDGDLLSQGQAYAHLRRDQEIWRFTSWGRDSMSPHPEGNILLVKFRRALILTLWVSF